MENCERMEKNTFYEEKIRRGWCEAVFPFCTKQKVYRRTSGQLDAYVRLSSLLLSFPGTTRRNSKAGKESREIRSCKARVEEASERAGGMCWYKNLHHRIHRLLIFIRSLSFGKKTKTKNSRNIFFQISIAHPFLWSSWRRLIHWKSGAWKSKVWKRKTRHSGTA